MVLPAPDSPAPWRLEVEWHFPLLLSCSSEPGPAASPRPPIPADNEQAAEKLPRAQAAQEEENESEPKMRSRKELLRSGFASPKTKVKGRGRFF